MSRPITISIPKPCHENWQEMTATERGAFCKSCQKEVIDFTKKTKDEIHRILSAGGATCGRFRTDQLELPIHQTTYIKSWWHWKAIAVSTIALLLHKPVAAQYSHQTSYMIKKVVLPKDSLMTNNRTTLITISGNVLNEADFGLANSNIYLLDSAQNIVQRIITDSTGKFSFSSDIESIKKCLFLKISSINHQDELIHFSLAKFAGLNTILTSINIQSRIRLRKNEVNNVHIEYLDSTIQSNTYSEVVGYISPIITVSTINITANAVFSKTKYLFYRLFNKQRISKEYKAGTLNDHSKSQLHRWYDSILLSQISNKEKRKKY